MKFKLYESVLNECVGSSNNRFVAEIEANNLQEARKIVAQQYPNIKAYSLYDGKNKINGDN
jgi:hypothetical protein